MGNVSTTYPLERHPSIAHQSTGRIYWSRMAPTLSCLQLEYLFYLQFFLLAEDHLGWQIWLGASQFPHPLLPVRPLAPLLQLHLETQESLARALPSPSAARVEEHGMTGFAETEQTIRGLFSCRFPPVMRFSLAKCWFHGPGRGCRPSYFYLR